MEEKNENSVSVHRHTLHVWGGGEPPSSGSFWHIVLLSLLFIHGFWSFMLLSPLPVFSPWDMALSRP